MITISLLSFMLAGATAASIAQDIKSRAWRIAFMSLDCAAMLTVGYLIGINS